MSAEFERKIDDLIRNKLERKEEERDNLSDDLILLDVEPMSSYEAKAKKIFYMLEEARALGRTLKTAYLEEELHAIG